MCMVEADVLFLLFLRGLLPSSGRLRLRLSSFLSGGGRLVSPTTGLEGLRASPALDAEGGNDLDAMYEVDVGLTQKTKTVR